MCRTESLIWTATLLLAFSIAWTSPAVAEDVPPVLAFQGLLLNNQSGEPLAGPIGTLEISIWDTEDPQPFTNPLYFEEHANVELRDGVFNIVIGTGTNQFGTLDHMTFEGMDRFLELVIDGDVLRPLLPFNSVAYALRAQKAESAKSVDAVGPSTITGIEVPLYVTLFGNCQKGAGTILLEAECRTFSCNTPLGPGRAHCSNDPSQCIFSFDGFCPNALAGYLLDPSQ